MIFFMMMPPSFEFDDLCYHKAGCLAMNQKRQLSSKQSSLTFSKKRCFREDLF